MTGTADPHEPPPLPAFQYRIERDPDVVLTGGPGRVYDDDAADPAYEPPRIRGFGVTAAELDTSVQRAAHAGWPVADLAGLPEADVERTCNGPRLWQDEGDQA